jgi:hypothetical protein
MDVVARGITSEKGTAALQRLHDLVEEHGTDAQRQKLDKIAGGRVPSPARAPLEFEVYLAEALVAAFEIFGEHIEQSKPRPRGRPRKDAAQQTR